MSRSIVIPMRRRSPHEPVEEFRYRRHQPLGEKLCSRLGSWGKVVGPSVGEAWPDLPEGITDRKAEAWEPLIAVADAAGGDWSVRARAAASALCRLATGRRVGLGIRLLADLRTIFGDADALHTETIIERLCNGEKWGLEADVPWSGLYGKGIDARHLASILKRYGVSPLKVKVAGRALQGYRRDHLWDVWVRYLPGVPAKQEPAEPSLKPCRACDGTAFWRVRGNGDDWHCCKCIAADPRLGFLEFAEAQPR